MPDQSIEPTLYSQADGIESANVRRWLVAHGISFTERDASADPAAARALATTGTFATPLLVAGEKRVFGFQPEALTEALQVIHPPPRQPC